MILTGIARGLRPVFRTPSSHDGYSRYRPWGTSIAVLSRISRDRTAIVREPRGVSGLSPGDGSPYRVPTG